jgi:uncharacterized protein (DUF1800 family)
LSIVLLLWTFGVASHAAAQTSLSNQAAARFLDQATWGSTPASVAALQKTTMEGWLTVQYQTPSSTLPAQPINDPDGQPNLDFTPVQRAFFQNTLAGQDQLRQRVAFALSEIWVISGFSDRLAYAVPPYWSVLSNNAFGNYRDIIKAVTLSPGMGRYLNMANSNQATAAAGSSPNENYGRELMQVLTIGLNHLNQDGSLALDAHGNPIANYTNDQVTDMARLLTGWTYPTQPGVAPVNNNPNYFIGQLYAVESDHDTGSKTIFGGVQVPAGQTAEQDLNSLLDALMAQKSMAPFVCAQLIQHLVTSNPSPAYISRVSAVFQNDGTGVVGNMQKVISAILLDPEARAGDQAGAAPVSGFGHFREPVLFLANLLRGLNATLTPTSGIQVASSDLGQDLFFAPSIFNFFSPSYQTPSGVVAPELQIYSTATASLRTDVVNDILYGSIDGTTTFDLSPFKQCGANNTDLVNYISAAFLHSTMSSDLRAACLSAANAATSPGRAVQAALYVALTSAEYQVIH